MVHSTSYIWRKLSSRNADERHGKVKRVKTSIKVVIMLAILLLYIVVPSPLTKRLQFTSKSEGHKLRDATFEQREKILPTPLELTCSSTTPDNKSLATMKLSIRDIASQVCPNIIDNVADKSDIVRSIRGLSQGNWEEAFTLHRSLANNGSLTLAKGFHDTEFRGLSIREMALIELFTSKILDIILSETILIDLPELDNFIAAMEADETDADNIKFIYLAEFSGCTSVSNSRYGLNMVLNLAQSLKNANIPRKKMMFYTWDASCIKEAKKYPELFVLDVQQLALLFPICQRDLDSASRVVLTWEILKRNVSIFNIDADAVFFKQFPASYMAADIAGATYSSVESSIVNGAYRGTDAYLDPHLFNNFGQWWWKATPSAKSVFRDYLKFTVSDVIGSSPGKQSWHCDDQNAFARFLQIRQVFSRIRSVSSGIHKNPVNPVGDIDFRVFEPELFPMASLAMRGWLSSEAVSLHMTTYGAWKVFGLRELGLWYLDDLQSWSPQNLAIGERFVKLQRNEAPYSQEKELDDLISLIAFARLHTLTFIMPWFVCDYTVSKELVNPKLENRCTFEFHYDFSGLVALGVPFIFENEVEKVLGENPRTVSVDFSSDNIKKCSLCLLHLDQNISYKLPMVEEHKGVVRNAIMPNPRVHGCC
jgi:hypothetical protein